jgi:Uncharacterised protein family (UPF0158)
MANLDVDELIAAMEDQNATWFFDKQKGELVFDHPDLDEKMREMMDIDQLEENPERFVKVERVHPSDGFHIMQDFVETVTDEKIAEALNTALEKRHPFRQFKDTLHNYSDELTRWYAYHEARLKEVAEAWIEAEGLEITLVDRHNK